MKKHVFAVLSIIILLLLAASCSQITQDPNFSVVDTYPIGFQASPTTEEFLFETIDIDNNTSVETKIDKVWYQYVLNGTVLYNPAGNGDTLFTISSLLKGNGEIDGDMVTYSITLENFPFPFDSIVNDYMFTNDIQSITLRIFVSGVDNYGYNKRYTTSTDIAIFQ